MERGDWNRMSDFIHERGKALENQFFRDKDQHLLEQLRQEMQDEDARKALAASSGIEDDQALQAFLQLVLGATDFLVFSDVMRDTAKRQYYFQIMAMWHTSMGREAK